MSASSKKKLRNEQKAAKMTEKQLAEQKEAKKLKLYTTIFVAVLAVLLVVAICVGINQTIANSGIREKNTVAVTIGEHELSNAEFNYYYIDAINTFYSQYGTYAAMFGLDVTKPLNEQYTDAEQEETWADYFIASAMETARSVYALNDAAKAAGHTLSETEQLNVDAAISNATLYASMYGYDNAEDYLKLMYGNGTTEESYRAYVEASQIADSFYMAYGDSLTYADADLRAAEAENFDAYSSYTYNYYYLPTSNFLEGGTTDESGVTTYTDEEKAASVAAAEEAAKALTAEEITSVEALDKAIAGLSINEGSENAASTLCEDYGYKTVNSLYIDWMAADERAAGDVAYFANTTTSTDAEGNETTTTNGYYVVMFGSSNDNTFALKNVRHIQVAFEGGTYDSATGAVTYSEEEKAAAKTAAEEILAQWTNGDATEESFAALANEKSHDGDGTTGGLYENVYPGQMVAAFEDWCYDENRTTGDTGIIESEYGYHVMYFVGDAEQTYRDLLITNELTSADLQAWYTSLTEAITATEVDTQYLLKDLVLSSN